MELKDEFVTPCEPRYRWKVGRSVATSLFGFLAGLAVATIFFLTLFDISLKN